MSVLTAACLLIGAALLVWSGIAHVRRFGAFHATVVAHRIVPYAAARWVARANVVAELLVGSVAVVAVLGAAWWPGPVIRMAAVLVAGCYALFAGYLAIQLRRAPGVACGCFGDDEPTSVATVVRAVLLGAAAAVAALLPSARVGIADVALAVLAAIPLTVVIRYLPTLVGSRTVGDLQ